MAVPRPMRGLDRVRVYSWLLSNWVFLVTNALILGTAIAGEVIYLRNRRGKARA